MEGNGKVTTNTVIEYFKKQNIEISIEEAEMVLIYLKELADGVITSYLGAIRESKS